MSGIPGYILKILCVFISINDKIQFMFLQNITEPPINEAIKILVIIEDRIYHLPFQFRPVILPRNLLYGLCFQRKEKKQLYNKDYRNTEFYPSAPMRLHPSSLPLTPINTP